MDIASSLSRHTSTCSGKLAARVRLRLLRTYNPGADQDRDLMKQVFHSHVPAGGCLSALSLALRARRLLHRRAAGRACNTSCYFSARGQECDSAERL